jgi:hypothetical protein
LPVAGLTRLRGPPLPEYSPSLPKAFRTRPLYPRTYLWLVLRASAAHHGRSTHLRFRRLSVHGPCTLVLTCSWTYTPPWPATAGRTSLRFRRPSVQPLAPGRRTVVRRPSLTYMYSHRRLPPIVRCNGGSCAITRGQGIACTTAVRALLRSRMLRRWRGRRRRSPRRGGSPSAL